VQSGPLTYTLEGTTALVRMDDGKANALSVAMIEALLEALSRAEREAEALVLVGREGRFCAGFDLKTMMSGPDAAKDLLRRGSELYLRFFASPLPIVMACTGHALAGGALLALVGDVRLLADGPFKVGLNEVQIGLPVPVLAMELARARLDVRELSRATLMAQVYDPAGAVRAGYVDEVVASDALLSRAHDEAKRLGGLPRRAYAETKTRLRRATIELIRSTFEDDMKTLLEGAITPPAS
jgi:enoyl-CoA hydratase